MISVKALFVLSAFVLATATVGCSSSEKDQAGSDWSYEKQMGDDEASTQSEMDEENAEVTQTEMTEETEEEAQANMPDETDDQRMDEPNLGAGSSGRGH